MLTRRTWLGAVLGALGALTALPLLGRLRRRPGRKIWINHY